jgi:REP element-mobilizing transposase RayT
MNGKNEVRMAMIDRKRPTHPPNVLRHNTPVIVFLTVCATDRTMNTFATDTMHQILRNTWAAACSHLVGSYVLMPDHVHLFCAPASPEAENVAKWVRYWKSLVTREVRGKPVGGASVCLPKKEDEQTLVPPGAVRGVDEQTLVPPGAMRGVDEQTLVPPGAMRGVDEQTLVPPGAVRGGEGRASARPVAHVSSVFQRDCWDTQLRRGESYHEKWEYVRNNPVRRGLAASADMWPYWGVMHELVW